MSKSKGNVVDPNYLIDRYGADTARLFCLFAAPPEKDLDWSDQGVEGAFRFIARVWRLVYDKQSGSNHGQSVAKDLKFHQHKTIKKVTEDLDDRFHFNTAIAAIMEYVNYLQQISAESGATKEYQEALQTLVLLLAPFIPHVCEELWAGLGNSNMVALERWPTFDQKHLLRDEMKLVVQVNGKLRADMMVSTAIGKDEVLQKAKELTKIIPYLTGKKVLKEIYVPNKLVNFVVAEN